MQYYQIKVDKDVLPINKNKTYNFKTMLDLKTKLNVTKDKLEDIFKNQNKLRLWQQCDPFKKEKSIIKTIANEDYVTNAWIKIYEIVQFFNLIPDTITSDYCHFDNAAFPGAFILAVRNYIYTKTKCEQYNWIGSSLIVAKKDVDPLEDKYELYKRYKKNWLMNDQFNGDVTLVENQDYIKNRLGNQVDLYTSDLGFSVDNDFGNQESIHFLPNVGQILFGLNCLKKGGCFVTKQFTIMETNTVSVIYAIANMFDEFYICKPFSSRAGNSELYLVGKGFKGIGEYQSYIDRMYEILSDAKLEILSDAKPEANSDEAKTNLPLFDARLYKSNYIKTIVSIAEQITNHQIKTIESNLESIRLGRYDYDAKAVTNWYLKYQPKPMFDEDKLKLKIDKEY